MIIKYYGGNINIDTLSEMCQTTKKGTSAYHIIKAAESLGFEAEGLRCDLDMITEENVHFPIIAHTLLENKYLHYVVIYKVDQKHKYFLVADPQNGIKKISFSSFALLYNHTILTFIPLQKLPIEKENYSFYHTIYLLLKKYRNDVLIFLFLSLLFTLFSIVTSFYISSMMKSITYKSYSYLFLIFIIFLQFYLFKIASNYFKNLILIFLNQKIDFVLIEESLTNILSLPYSYYKNHTTGDVLSRISDITLVKESLSKMCTMVFIDLFLSLISFFFLYKIGKPFCFISIFCVILSFFLSFFVSKKIPTKIVTYQTKKSTTMNLLFEIISGFESIKGMHLEKNIRKQYIKEYVKLLKENSNMGKVSIQIQMLQDFIETMGSLLLIYIAIKMILKHKLSSTMLFAIVNLFHYILEPSRSLLINICTYKESISAFNRMQSLFYHTKEKGFIDTQICGNIEVKNLSYQYNETQKLLEKIDFSIRKGQKVLMLGKSGSGKSTFLKILKGYYPVNRNQIFLDNIDITDYKKECLERDICYISQKEMLFSGRLYENISMYKNIDQKWLYEVIKICEISPILEKDSLGIYQMIEEGGFHLSGGEAQRIILARSLMKNFSILLIDEGFSQMDPLLERKILKRIFRVYMNKTMIVVSHRMDNMDLYDKIIQFGKTKVTQVEKQENGRYRIV